MQYCVDRLLLSFIQLNSFFVVFLVEFSGFVLSVILILTKEYSLHNSEGIILYLLIYSKIWHRFTKTRKFLPKFSIAGTVPEIYQQTISQACMYTMKLYVHQRPDRSIYRVIIQYKDEELRQKKSSQRSCIHNIPFK